MNLWKMYDNRADLTINSVEDVLHVGAPVIPKNHVDRIDNIDVYKLLYDGDRDVLSKYYSDELVKYGVYKENNYNNMMIIINYCKQATIDLKNLSISTNPSISADKKTDNNKIQKWIKDKNIYKRLIEKILINTHVTGNCFVRIIPDNKNEYNGFQVLDTEQVFPVVDLMTNEIKAYVMITRYSVGTQKKARYLVSEYGKDTVYDVTLSGEQIVNITEIGSKETGIEGYTIVNFLVNENVSFPEYGVSSYTDAVSLQSAIIKGVNTIAVIQEKYASPILTGPPIGEMEHDNELNMCMSPNEDGITTHSKVREDMELTGAFVANSSDKDLKYIEFKGNTDLYNEYIKNTLEPAIVKSLGGMETLYQRSETPIVDSSKALRLLYSQAINLAEGYCESLKDRLVWLVKILTKVSKNSNVNIVFYPGIADFSDERIDYAEKRMADGTYTAIDAIMYLDGINEEEAMKKYEKIREFNMKNEEKPNEEVKE